MFYRIKIPVWPFFIAFIIVFFTAVLVDEEVAHDKAKAKIELLEAKLELVTRKLLVKSIACE